MQQIANEQPDPSRAVPRGVLEFLVFAIPALWLGSLIFRYGVDSPWADQWDGTFPLLLKARAGTLGLGDFFAFHNEHRIFFPSLLAVFLALLTNWNTRVELLVIWLLVCCCAFNIWRIARLTGHRDSPSHLWLLLTASILLFTPLQWENLLWGFQIGFLLPLACMTALPWVAVSVRWPLNFASTIVLCLMSTFSIASGFVSWVIAGTILLLTNGNPKPRLGRFCWLVWISVALLSVTLYFHGFTRPGWHPSEAEAFRHPFTAVLFALCYLGLPFSDVHSDEIVLAASAGGALLVVLCLALAYLWSARADRAFVKRSALWLALIFTALVNCFLVMLGRAGFGIEAAMRSRYVSFAILLPIGLLFLAAQIFNHWNKRQCGSNRLRNGMLSASLTLGITLALLLCLATVRVVRLWPALQHGRFSGKATMFLMNVIDQPDEYWMFLFPNRATKEWAGSLNQLGYLRPSPLRSNRIAEIDYSVPGEFPGTFQVTRGSDGSLNLVGWAILPAGDRVADCVLLTSEDEQGDPLIFDRVDVGGPRDFVAGKLNDESLRNCGWIKSLPPEKIPAGMRRIRAWALDADQGRAYLLGGWSI